MLRNVTLLVDFYVLCLLINALELLTNALFSASICVILVGTNAGTSAN